MDESHLALIVGRLRRELGVDAAVGNPQVAYREALTRPAEGEMKYARQTGGHRQYGHVKIRVYPGEPGTGYVFVNHIVGGAIPREFVMPINEGIKEALTRGVLAGYPIDHVKVELYDGSYHDVDSSDLAFKIAGAMAFEDAAKKAEPVLIEPVMKVEVTCPSDDSLAVLSDLAGRRSTIESQAAQDRFITIVATVPLAEMLGYDRELGHLSHDRAAYSMQFAHFRQVPQHITEELLLRTRQGERH
jgi:elongation factor G